MRRDDLMWKAVLEEVFEDFLRFFYSDADKLFDMEKGFEYLDKELEQLFPPEDGEYAPRFVDKLVKVFKKDGTEDWLLIHIETMLIFDKEVQQLTGRSVTMGTEEYLLEKAKNTGLQEGIQKGVRKGMREGAEKSKEQTVKNLIEQLDLADAQIAGIVEVSVDFVKNVRANLKR